MKSNGSFSAIHLLGSPAPFLLLCQFLVSVSKENSSTAEVLESISRSVRVKPENLRLAEVRYFYLFGVLNVDRRFIRVFVSPPLSGG